MAARIGRWLIAWLVLLPALAGAAGNVEFTARVNRERLSLDETLQLDVSLVTEGEEASELELPLTPDFEVLSRGRSDQTSIDFSGMRMVRRRVRTYTLLLRPLKEGRLPILPGKAVVGGRTFETERLEVMVLASGSGTAPLAGSRAGEEEPVARLSSDRERDVFLYAAIDKSEAWVGEQVVLSVYLFSRVDISGVDGFRLPKLDGFWMGDIASPTQLSARTQLVEGIPYRRYLISRKALFPLQAGTMRLGPVSIDVAVGSFPFGRARRIKRQSAPMELVVKALPAPAPAGFSKGNVGRWELRAEAAPREVAVGEAVTVRLVADGIGNPASLELPRLPPLEGAKAFEPTTTETASAGRGGYGGEKRLETILIPERAGVLEIPALEWTIFDVEAGAYRSLRTEPLRIEVRAAAGGGIAAALPEEGGDGGLAPIRGTIALVPAQKPLWERPWFLAALLLPLLGAAVALAVPGLRRGFEAGAGERRARFAGRLARRRLERAASLRGAALFEELQRTLDDYLEQRLGASVAGARREELLERLLRAGLDGEVARALLPLLDRCDEGRFAPIGGDAAAAHALLEEVKAWIERSEAGWRQP